MIRFPLLSILLCLEFFANGYRILENGAVNSVVVDPDPDADPSRNPLEEQDDDIVTSDKDEAVRNAHSEEDFRWPDGLVPYEVQDDVSEEVRKAIRNAIAQFHKYSCIRFIERRRVKDADYVVFQDRGACFSNVGRVGGQQIVSLAATCAQRATAMHELMHTLGFFHEHNRPDRDAYVEIMWRHIKPKKKGNFCANDGSYCSYNNMRMPRGQTFNVLYDYGSLMHYGDRYFTLDGSRTISPRVVDAEIGQRNGFSDYDLIKLNTLYQCEGYNGIFTPPPTTEEPRGTEKPPPQDCKDRTAKCSEWAEGGNCDAFPGKTLRDCAKSCGNCDKRKCYNSKSPFYYSQCVSIKSAKDYRCKNELFLILCPLACGKCSEKTGWPDAEPYEPY